LSLANNLCRRGTQLAILFVIQGVSHNLFAHDPITTQITWNREISRIIYNRCASCHRDGGAAFSLLTYQVARPWAKAIKEEVLERRMPPFAAVKGFGQVHDDGALTQEEMHLVADWVEGGSPEGDDPKLLPKLPDFSSRSPAPSPAAGASAEPPNSVRPLIADGSLTLKEPVVLLGARAAKMPEGASIQVVYQKPNGPTEPLIWIYDYKPKFDREYFFEKPIALPAGSKIMIYPSNGGTLAFLVKK